MFSALHYTTARISASSLPLHCPCKCCPLHARFLTSTVLVKRLRHSAHPFYYSGKSRGLSKQLPKICSENWPNHLKNCVLIPAHFIAYYYDLRLNFFFCKRSTYYLSYRRGLRLCPNLNVNNRGSWVSQSNEHPMLGFSSGHDSRVMRLSCELDSLLSMEPA